MKYFILQNVLLLASPLFQHPTISECCVLGLPDPHYGEAVTAIVIPDSEIKSKRDEELKPALTLEELTEWAKQKLAPYKVSTIYVINCIQTIGWVIFSAWFVLFV